MVQSTASLLSKQGFLVFHSQFSFEKIYFYQTLKKQFTIPMWVRSFYYKQFQENFVGHHL